MGGVYLKKYKIFAYILIVLFIVGAISFATYRVMSKSKTNEQQIKDKSQSEIEYIEGSLLKMFNHMNNIEFENYKISIGEVNQSSTGESSGKSSNGGTQSAGNGGSGDSSSVDSGNSGNGGGSENGDSGSDSGSGSGSDSDSGSGSSSSSDTTSGDSKNANNGSSSTQVYELQKTGVLTKDENINWTTVKNEVEDLYLSIPTITLDLYQTEADEQDILNFNTEYDILTKTVQEENKLKTLQQLVKVYEVLVKIADKSEESEIDKTVLKTKLNIYKAYSKLDESKWDEISSNTKSAVEEFAKLMTKKDIEEQKQYAINKIYIMLSELQKSTDKKDVQIFLIKYKNMLEELNNI